MEISEIIAAPSMHETEDHECPFCPPPGPEENFTTYPGSEKNEDRLKSIMAKPSSLGSEGNPRPKEGQPGQQKPASAKHAPAPPLQHPVFGAYTYEAHHLIPGTEKVFPKSSASVMSGHAIEKWIVKGPKIDRDSGYSINNSDNGVWLPSAPASVKKNPANQNPSRPWASERKAKGDPDALSPDEKLEIAEFAKGAGQFHYGQHKVAGEEGTHYTYPKTVHDRLTALEQLVSGWSTKCLCDKKQGQEPSPPFKPTWKINEKLDLISMWIEIDIRLMPASTWKYFISTLAKKVAEGASRMRSA